MVKDLYLWPIKMLETIFIILGCMVIGHLLYTTLKADGTVLPSFLLPLLCGVVAMNVAEFLKKVYGE